MYDGTGRSEVSLKVVNWGRGKLLPPKRYDRRPFCRVLPESFVSPVAEPRSAAAESQDSKRTTRHGSQLIKVKTTTRCYER